MTVLFENGTATGFPCSTSGVPQREMRLLVAGLHEWLDGLTTQDGSPGLFGFLEGEAGQGQTETLGAVRDMCQDLGIRVLWSRASRHISFPPGFMGDLVDQGLENSAPDAENRGIATSVGHSPSSSLISALPSLGPELDRSWLVDKMATTLLELSSGSPLLIIIENLERADDLSLEVLRQLTCMVRLRRDWECAPRVLVIASVPAGESDGQLLRGWKGPSTDLEAFRILARGYSREDLREVAFTILGEDAPLSFRERVYRLTGGNVRHIRWLLWYIRENGGLHDLRAGHSDADFSFRRLVERRFSDLPEGEQHWVSVLAAAGRPCPQKFFLRGAGLVDAYEGAADGKEKGARELPATLRADSADNLYTRGWVAGLGPWTKADGRGLPALLGVIDADVGDIVLEHLDRPTRTDIHLRLGDVLEQESGETKNNGCVAHAFQQFRWAGDSSGIMRLAMPSAQHLERMGCPIEALEVLTDFVDVCSPSDGALAAEIEAYRAEILDRTSTSLEAIAIYKELLSRSSAVEERSRLHRLIGDIHGRLGEQERQLEEYNAALCEVGEDNRSFENLRTLASFAKFYLEAEDLEASLGYLDRCLERLEEKRPSADGHDHEVYKLAEQVHFHLSHYVEATEFENRLLRCYEEKGDAPGQLRSLKHLSHLYSLAGDWAAAEARLLEAIAVAEASGSRWLLAQALKSLGLFKRDRNQVEAALEQLEKASRLMADLGRADAAHDVGFIVLGLEFELGRFANAVERATVLAEGCTWNTEGRPGQQPEAPPGLTASARRKSIRELQSKGPGTESAHERASRTFELARLLEDEGRLTDAHLAYQDCLQRDFAGDSMLRSRAAQALARIEELRGDFDGALRFLEQGLKYQGKTPSREILREAYFAVSDICLERGDIQRSFEYTVRGLWAVLEDRDINGVLRAFQGMSSFLNEVGMVPAATHMAEAFLLLAQVAELPRWELSARRHVVAATVRRGDQCLSGRVTERWRELSKKMDLPVESCRMKLEFGWDCYNKRDFAEALRFGREGIELARARGLQVLLDDLLHLVGVVESARRNPRKNFLRALEALEQALGGAESRKRPRLSWEVLQHMERIYKERGKQDLAEEYARRAEEIERSVSERLPAALMGIAWRPRIARRSLLHPAEVGRSHDDR